MKSRQTIGTRIHLVTDDGVEVGTGILDMHVNLTHPKVVKAGEIVQLEVSIDAIVDSRRILNRHEQGASIDITANGR